MPRLPPIRTQVASDVDATMPNAVAAGSGSSNSAAAQAAMQGGAITAAAAATAVVASRTTSAAANDMLSAGNAAADEGGRLMAPGVLRFDSHEVNNTQEDAGQATHQTTATAQQQSEQQKQQQQQPIGGAHESADPHDVEMSTRHADIQQQQEGPIPACKVMDTDVDMVHVHGNHSSQENRGSTSRAAQYHTLSNKRQKIAGESVALAAAFMMPTGPASALAAPPQSPPQTEAATIAACKVQNIYMPHSASVKFPTGPAPVLASATDGSSPRAVNLEQSHSSLMKVSKGSGALKPGVQLLKHDGSAKAMSETTTAGRFDDENQQDDEGVDAIAHILEGQQQ